MERPSSVAFNPKYYEALKKLDSITMEGNLSHGLKYKFENLPFSFDEEVEDWRFVYCDK